MSKVPKPKRYFRIHAVTFAVISCCIMAVPVALWALPLVDRYQEAPSSVVSSLPDFSVGPADWRELYWHKNKPAAAREAYAQTDLPPEVLYDRVAPSVVTIIVKDENEEPIASGSGFFTSQERDIFGPPRTKSEGYFLHTRYRDIGQTSTQRRQFIISSKQPG